MTYHTDSAYRIFMREKILLKLALAICIIGIVLLFFLSRGIEVNESMLGKLENSIDQTVIVTGTVVDVSQKNSTTFLRIQKDEMASVVLFGKAPVLNEGDFVQIRGKVSENKEYVGIIGEEVRVI